MKKLIFLILKKLKIDSLKLLKFYVNNKLNLEFKPNTTIDNYCSNIEEFEKLIDSILRYIKHQNAGVLYNIANLKKETILLRTFYSNNKNKYIENIHEVNLRVLKKILEIKETSKLLDSYHSRNLKTHIIYIEDYLSVITL